MSDKNSIAVVTFSNNRCVSSDFYFFSDREANCGALLRKEIVRAAAASRPTRRTALPWSLRTSTAKYLVARARVNAPFCADGRSGVVWKTTSCTMAPTVTLPTTLQASVDRTVVVDAAAATAQVQMRSSTASAATESAGRVHFQAKAVATACRGLLGPRVSLSAVAFWYRIEGRFVPSNQTLFFFFLSWTPRTRNARSGLLATASTCNEPQTDTALLVATGDCQSFKCVAVNDDSVRGRAFCRNGGSEVSWHTARGTTYWVVAYYVGARPPSALNRSTPMLTSQRDSHQLLFVCYCCCYLFPPAIRRERSRWTWCGGLQDNADFVAARLCLLWFPDNVCSVCVRLCSLVQSMLVGRRRQSRPTS